MHALISHFLLLILYVTGRVRSRCYIDTNCRGRTLAAIDQADCCIGTNDGIAYLNSEGNCTACIGEFVCCCCTLIYK